MEFKKNITLSIMIVLLVTTVPANLINELQENPLEKIDDPLRLKPIEKNTKFNDNPIKLEQNQNSLSSFGFNILNVFSNIFSETLSLVDNILGNEQNSLNAPLETNTNFVNNLLNLNSPKLDSLLKQEATSLGKGEIKVIVLFNKKPSTSEINQINTLSNNVKYQYSLIDATAISIDVSNLDELADLIFVKEVQLDSPTKAFLAQSTTQTGASRVWFSHNVEGKGITIAILDTGIDNNHPDLKNVVNERDFTGEGTDDLNGHGTHVASIAAGSGSLSQGLNRGLAPEAELMDIKVLNSLGQGLMSDTIAGIQYAVLNDADIISLSLGAEIPCNGLDATSLATDAAVAQGVHVVVAAGNTGPLPGTIGSPGCARNVITVGAVDRLDNIAAFSSRGPTLDNRIKPDIVAPGVLILAAQSKGTYTAKSGTSMATPHVSGVIALILSENPGLSPEQIKSLIKDTALDLNEASNTQGSGRIQAYEAFIEGTGLTPVEKEDAEGKQEAERKARQEEEVEDVKAIREKEDNNQEYYVVDGTRTDENGKKQRIWVWYNKLTKEIERVEVLNFLKAIWIDILDFFQGLIN